MSIYRPLPDIHMENSDDLTGVFQWSRTLPIPKTGIKPNG